MTRARLFLAPALTAVLLAAPPVVLTVVLAPAAHAQSASKATVDAAKAAGVVGELHDGTLGIVSAGDAAVRSAVAEINEGRARAYRSAAVETGVTPIAAGEAAYRLLLGRMPAGQYYKPAGGGWMRK